MAYNTTDEAKKQRMKNIRKKTVRQIPSWMITAAKRLNEEFPEAAANPQYVDLVLKEAFKALMEEFADGTTTNATITSFGRFKLLEKKCYVGERAGGTQLHVKYEMPQYSKAKIRVGRGTATKTDLAVIEKGDDYLKNLRLKRAEYVAERKNKMIKIEEGHPDYITEIQKALNLNL